MNYKFRRELPQNPIKGKAGVQLPVRAVLPAGVPRVRKPVQGRNCAEVLREARCL
jgi:hypothetical protein